MAATIPTTEPTRLTAGDSWRWDRSLADYPAGDGWVLKYALSKASTAPVILTATADGDTHEIRVSASTTADYPAGLYTLTGYVELDDERFQVYTGALTVDPDPATTTPDASHAEEMVSLLRTAIQAAATSGIVEYTIAGPDGSRGVKRVTMKEAREELAYWESRLAKERGFSGFRKVEVTFGCLV